MLELFGRMVIPRRVGLCFRIYLIAFYLNPRSGLLEHQASYGEFSERSVIGRETLEDGNFETVTQIL